MFAIDAQCLKSKDCAKGARSGCDHSCNVVPYLLKFVLKFRSDKYLVDLTRLKINVKLCPFKYVTGTN